MLYRNPMPIPIQYINPPIRGALGCGRMVYSRAMSFHSASCPEIYNLWSETEQRIRMRVSVYNQEWAICSPRSIGKTRPVSRLIASDQFTVMARTTWLSCLQRGRDHRGPLKRKKREAWEREREKWITLPYIAMWHNPNLVFKTSSQRENWIRGPLFPAGLEFAKWCFFIVWGGGEALSRTWGTGILYFQEQKFSGFIRLVPWVSESPCPSSCTSLHSLPHPIFTQVLSYSWLQK